MIDESIVDGGGEQPQNLEVCTFGEGDERGVV